MARPELSKSGTGAVEPSDDETRLPPMLAMSIQQFCFAHNISEDFYYKLKRKGEEPREMKVGRRTLISHEAATEWRRRREAIGGEIKGPAKQPAQSAPVKTKPARATRRAEHASA
ncbi:hypothetical protein ABIF68_010402 [Bradyrhizobium japonicum]|nr:hypothetical protein [Bradyrhizobium sp. Mp27]MDI2076510.1 hypothetical protein [Bradyrhizobium sp. Mp27]